MEGFIRTRVRRPQAETPYGERWAVRVSLRRRLAMLLVILAWTGFVLYPNPRTLAVSLSRLAQPPVDPAAVSTLAAGLPDDPVAVEAFSQGYVAYEYA